MLIVIHIFFTKETTIKEKGKNTINTINYMKGKNYFFFTLSQKLINQLNKTPHIYSKRYNAS